MQMRCNDVMNENHVIFFFVLVDFVGGIFTTLKECGCGGAPDFEKFPLVNLLVISFGLD